MERKKVSFQAFASIHTLTCMHRKYNPKLSLCFLHVTQQLLVRPAQLARPCLTQNVAGVVSVLSIAFDTLVRIPRLPRSMLPASKNSTTCTVSLQHCPC
jgi:hypothetical protein